MFTCTKLTLSDRLPGPLRLISIAQQATKLLFSLAQDPNLHAPGNRTWVFSCPVFARESYSCTMPTKFVALEICRCLRTHNDDDGEILGKNTCQCFYIEFNGTYKCHSGWFYMYPSPLIIHSFISTKTL